MTDTTRRQWGVIVALWLLLVWITAYEIVPASVLPAVMAALSIGPAAGSWIVSALLLSMATLAIPAGVVLDRVDDRVAVVVASVGLLATTVWAWRAGTAGAYPSLLAARFVGGIAIVVAWTASVNVVGAAFPGRRQATAIGLLSTSIPAGFAVGQFTGPIVAAAFDWTATFPAFGVLAVVTAAIFWVASRPVELAAREASAPTRSDFRRVLADGRVWSVGIMGFVAFSLNLFFNSWTPTYLVERFAVSLAQGGAFAALFPAIGIVARAGSGPVSGRLFGHRRRPVVLGSFLVTVPLVAALGLADAVPVFAVALVAAGFSVQLGLALLFTYVRELVAPNVVGTALAVLNAVGFLGAFTAPIVTGEVVERTGSFLPAFGYVGALALVGAGLAYWAPEPGGEERS